MAPLDVERFWSKVDRRGPEECWPWLGASFKGRGRFGVAGRTRIAPRVSLALSLGRSIGAGFQACHRCDNPICVNPAHLYEGTHQQNMRDRVSRGPTSTHCVNGHEYGVGNLYLAPSKGDRRCMECARLHRNEYKRRKRVAAEQVTA